jgi:polysaccharide export outer membrane protein
MSKYYFSLLCGFLMCSCVSKKEIFYVQDVDAYADTAIPYTNSKIQPNDILSIRVVALVAETAIPYNQTITGGGGGGGGGAQQQLMGYLVSETLTLNFPNLGVLSVADKTTQEFAAFLKHKLEDEGHLKKPSVDVRLMNAKFTILGEVGGPGTYEITEPNITLLQALGYAGDLTINGVREDIIIMRDELGVRQITHIDLTTSDWINGPYYFIKPNDVILVSQNTVALKKAGVIGSLPALIGIFSTTLALTLLLTR